MSLASFNQWPWHHWAICAPEKQAALLYGESLTWQQLAIKINAIAHSFRQQGVSEGSGVILRGKNSTELLLCYLGALQCGARVLPLNPQLPASLLVELLPRLNIEFVADFTHSSFTVIQATELNWQTKFTVTSGKSVSGKRVSWDLISWDIYRPASMILTSGSSGLPKAVVHSVKAHLASAKGVLSCIDFTSHDRWLLSLPLYHVSGQGILWRWLLKGAELVLEDMRFLDSALSGCTHASLVPTQLWRWLSQPREHQQTLKDVLLGGAMIPQDLIQQAEERGIRCWCGYGMTEMASTVCAKRADGLPGVGTPLPGKEIRLQDEEIQIKADSIAMGYWSDGKLQPLIRENGWFATRDRGAFEQGELCILGRLDNQFFSGGEGIQPEDIERIINLHPDIQQSFVVPVPDTEFGHRPVMVIETNSPTLTTTLVSWLSDKLASFQQPVACYLLPEQFKNDGIKIPRQQVKRWVLEKYSTPTS
ncbi:o-succinylbenzoate--CoA ligase [Xenorhabdus innexi]|uniref:2-succinylbenzoate--CoA ligase n=1 Tax=Xenorhabdus innexi TaxID=290109 RepID=A0A1N6MW16_9GAMM|nr:o-succinylbenzoate--CoA ligase [Xenorhabdus innexi]PHM37539.1 putative chain-fatty-acid-CoA ligase FadD13 [Xenorhabdus innexi]SIP72977.1 2-succinylbenzoate--CoA ligase [Xenorhabdus innexi]